MRGQGLSLAGSRRRTSDRETRVGCAGGRGRPEAAAMAAGAAPEGAQRLGRRQGALRSPRGFPAPASGHT